MEKQATLSEESGDEIPNVLKPSVENSSPGGDTEDKDVELRKLVMEVIFGTGQDGGTAHQRLFAALKGTKYEVKCSSSSSSSVATSPCSYARTPAFFSNDMAVSEETVNIKDEDKIMAQKQTALNASPEKNQRPVRNRIKLEREDFIYDLPDRCRDTKRENEDRLSSCSTVTRSRQQTEMAGSSMASSSNSTAHSKDIPKLVLIRTNSSVPATKIENDSSSSTEDLVGASEVSGEGSVAYKVSKRKSNLQDAKCKLVASNKERTD